MCDEMMRGDDDERGVSEKRGTKAKKRRQTLRLILQV